MFKIKLNDMWQVEVVDPGIGGWEVVYNGWVAVLEGYNGECSFTIQIIGWQSGHYVVCLTFGMVDDEIKQISFKTGGMENYKKKDLGKKDLEDSINAKIGEMYEQYNS